MSLYVSTTYFGDGSQVQYALRDLEKLKIKKIELGSNHSSVKNNKLNLKKNTKYIVHNYFPPEEKDFILNIASTRSQVRDKSIAFIKSSIIWCQKNDIKFYTIHPGFFAEAISPLGYGGQKRNFDLNFDKKSIVLKNRRKTLDETSRIIKHLYDFANGRTQLLIENQGSITSHNFTLFDSYDELKRLKKNVGLKLKFNFNLAHAYLSGINITDKKTFLEFYEDSPFFETSEIRSIYDSHLPLKAGNGRILKLLKEYKSLFRKSNGIFEYRNIEAEKLLKSYIFVSEILA